MTEFLRGFFGGLEPPSAALMLWRSSLNDIAFGKGALAGIEVDTYKKTRTGFPVLEVCGRN